MPDLVETFLSIFDCRYDGVDFPDIGSITIDQAYAVQEDVIQQRLARGESAAGYKVGCTSRAIQSQFGLSEPIFGRILHPFIYDGDQTLRVSDFCQPAIEPEFVITIGKTINSVPTSDDAIIDAIECVSPGIEIHHYKFWNNTPTIQELIASNGIHASLIVGENRTDPRDVDWEREEVEVLNHNRPCATGIATDIMGGPLNSLRWLITNLLSKGKSLNAGDLVIPGSATELIPVNAGDTISAAFPNIGTVTVDFK